MKKMAEQISFLVHAQKFSINMHLARKSTYEANFCVSLIRKEEPKYFANLNIKDVTDNKKFLKNY